MRRRSFIAVVTLLIVSSIVLVSCAGGGGVATGTLRFYANGEDFVRQGFVSKDGWSISFNHVYVHLSGITAYQTDPPYDPHTESSIDAAAQVGLSGDYTVDLAEGGADADPILVGQVLDSKVGHYNAVSWRMTDAPSGPAQGYCLAVIGTADKGNESINFSIKVETEYAYCCGEYVGEARKGIVEDDGVADVEMTFHFDHIFGDAEVPLDDHINIGATGFDPFAALAVDGSVDEDLASLETKLDAVDYQTLVGTLPTLGHVGEGHCHCEY